MSAEHWYLLPVGFSIAALAMSSGISAGNFWVPVYLLWAKFEPPLAFWMTLTTMLCGYGSGVVRNLRQGTIDRGVIMQYLPLTVPTALVGGILAPALNTSWMILLFGTFVLGYGVRMLVQMMRRHDPGAACSSPIHRPSQPSSARGEGVSTGLSIDMAAAGRSVPYVALGRADTLWQSTWLQGRAIGLLGGLLFGLITIGLGELLLPRLLTERKSLSPAEIVGSTVLVIFVTSLTAAVVRLNGPLLATLSEQRATLLGALLFAGPGAILGGQLGPLLVRHLDARALRWYAAILLLLVGILILVRFLALVAQSL